MNSGSFKAGDVIRCVDDTDVSQWLTKGRLYLVTKDSFDDSVWLHDVKFPASSERFQLAMTGSSPPPLPSPSTSQAPRPMCKTCIYGNEENGVAGIQCRRHAPTAVVMQQEILTKAGKYTVSDVSWPVMDGDDWCGEHPDMPAWIASQRREADAAKSPHEPHADKAFTRSMMAANLRTQTQSVLMQEGMWPQSFGKQPAGDPRKLLEMTREDLLEFHNCGPVTVKDIVDYLGRFGLRLAD